jgi:predicted outer membrane repeat protein
MKQRLATIATALALVGALFASVPSAVRADPATIYLGIYGADYTGAVAGCSDLDWTVGAGQDSSMGLSLASDAAHTDGTVYMCPGTYHFTYPVVNPPNNIHLIGAGATRTILDGGNTSRIVASEGSLVIESLTMQNAHGEDSDEGGAVLAGGTVSVTNAIFKHNFANKGGGAIAAFGAVTALDSVFVSNSTADQGGAIASYGSVSVTQSSFTNNASIADSECIGGGGAIAALDDVEAHNSTFIGNVARLGSTTNTDACGAFGHFGGLGGAIATGTLEFIYGSTFRGNRATLGGGAIFALGTRFPTETYAEVISSSFISNNITNDGLAGESCNERRGGNAIFQSSIVLAITDSSFISNGHKQRFAGHSFCNAGGAVFAPNYQDTAGVLVFDSIFRNNYGTYGGALSVAEGVEVYDSTFTGNSAAYAGGAITTNYAQIFRSTFTGNSALRGGALLFCNTSMVLNSAFTRNRALSSRVKMSGVTGLGGAILFSSDSGLTLTSNVFKENSASRAGGAVWLSAGAPTNLPLMTKNRFVRNRAPNTGGAVGFDKYGEAPTRAQITGALRANRFTGNAAAVGASIGGLRADRRFR